MDKLRDRKPQKDKKEVVNRKESNNDKDDDDQNGKIKNRKSKEEIKREIQLFLLKTVLLLSTVIIIIAMTSYFVYYNIHAENPGINKLIKFNSAVYKLLLFFSGATQYSPFPFHRLFLDYFGGKEEANEKFINNVRTVDITIPSLVAPLNGNFSIHPNYKIKARLFTPLRAVEKKEEERDLLIWFHSGRFNFGHYNDRLTTELCSHIANKQQIYVLSVDYRLSPEFQFPAPLEDAISTLEWLNSLNHPCIAGHSFDASNNHEFDICKNQAKVNTGRILIGGDDAGGNIAITSYLFWRDRLAINHSMTVIGLSLVSPFLFSSEIYESRTMNHYFLSKQSSDFFEENYLKPTNMSSKEYEDSYRFSLYKNPYLSPFSADLSDLPPMCLLLPAIDPNYHDGFFFTRKVIDDMHSQIKSIRYPNTVSGFLTPYFYQYPSTQDGRDKLVDCINSIMVGEYL